MSAPNAGRQSPEPSRQTGAQQSDPTSTKANQQGGAPTDHSAQDESNETKSKLSSNPTHPLAKASEEKTSKK